MKKWLIGSLVGGVIVFLWQFLSWTMLGIHDNAAKYHPAQDSIVSYLSSVIKEDGAYMLPTVKPGASNKDYEELVEKLEGKPWASLIYHTSYSYDMVRQMTRGFLVDVFLVFTLIYILTRGGVPTPVRVVAGSVAVGLFTFLWGPYMGHNWFHLPMNMILGDLLDALVAWGLTGLWLGWWLNRK
jgi:hypothetical protein